MLKIFAAGALAGLALAAMGGPALAQEASLEAKAKGFIETALNQHKVAEAFDLYVGPTYIQHNPSVPDGREGSTQALTWLTSTYPSMKVSVKRAFTDGNFVILHSHSTMKEGDPGQAIVDIFRFENGKIVEHWDVLQPVPAEAKNKNGMF